MSDPSGIAEHYSGENDLLARIEAALREHGARVPFDLDTLGLFDEFHIGGRAATAKLVDGLALSASSRVVDLGSGLGGPARYIAKTTGAHVTGVDLTPDFVEAGQTLTGMAVMLDRVRLTQGDICDLPFDNQSFDAGYMIHVGMNIADKAALAREAARVLKPDSRFVIYDVMALSAKGVTYPVPWASGPDQDALCMIQVYRRALIGAGFSILSETNRSDLMRPPPASAQDAVLGLHLVMGPEAGRKIGNMVEALRDGRIAPIEIVARLR